MQMTLFDAVRTCLSKYANFSGRATRSEYWWFFLAVLLGSAFAWIISPLRVYTLFSVAILLPLVAVGARRLHDTNRTGWWQLLALVPFGVFVVFLLLAQESKEPRPY